MTFHHMRAPRPAEVQPATVQVGPVTEALRAVRKAMTTPVRVGPVTEAIRTMRAAVPDFDRDEDVLSLRRALADRIEADLAVLDMLGGDADLEDGADDEPSLCGVGHHFVFGNLPELPQTGRGDGGDAYDIEGDDEHGGDIQDEPHDGEECEQDAGDEPEEENEHGGAVDDEGEYSLGSLCGTAAGAVAMSQHEWGRSNHPDLENEHDGREPEDSGIGDADGMWEQKQRFFAQGGASDLAPGWTA